MYIINRVKGKGGGRRDVMQCGVGFVGNLDIVGVEFEFVIVPLSGRVVCLMKLIGYPLL